MKSNAFAFVLVSTAITFAGCKQREFNETEVQSEKAAGLQPCVEKRFLAFNEKQMPIEVFENPNQKSLFTMNTYETMRCLGHEGAYYKVELEYESLRKFEQKVPNTKTAWVKAETVVPLCGVKFSTSPISIFSNSNLTNEKLKIDNNVPLACIRKFPKDEKRKEDSIQVRFGKDLQELGYVSPSKTRRGCGVYKVVPTRLKAGSEEVSKEVPVLSRIPTSNNQGNIQNGSSLEKTKLLVGEKVVCSRDFGIWKEIAFLGKSGGETGFIDGHHLLKISLGSEEERVELDSRNGVAEGGANLTDRQDAFSESMSLDGGAAQKEFVSAIDYSGAKLWGCEKGSPKSRNSEYTGSITSIQQYQSADQADLPLAAWRDPKQTPKVRPVHKLPYLNPYSTENSAATGYPHEGVDFSATGAPPWENPPYDLPVRAVADGTVVFVISGCNEGGGGNDLMCGDGWGNHVVVAHKGNVFSRYCHFQNGNPLVKVNQVVKAGTVLGKIGATGWAAGAHQHFEIGIMKPGAAINHCAPFKLDTLYDPSGHNGANEWTDP